MVSIGLYALYVLAKRKVNTDFFLEITDDMLSELSQNVDMQKKVYLLGVILGQGIKQGVGLSAKGGKFKIENLIGAALEGFLGNMFQGKGQETAQQPQNIGLPNLSP